MGNLSSLTFMLGANTKDFQTKMRKVSNDLRKTGKQMKSLGKSMSMYVTAPLVAMAGVSVAAFDKQAQAEQKLSAQIRQNGKDVESTMATYKTFASELQNVTTVGDEVTLGLMQMAESMSAPDVMGATQGAIALSKALGVDLQAALKMTVLAQNGEYTMLNRYVPALRNASSETEKAAIVSKLYSDGLEIAKTEAQTGLGPMKQLQNTIGDIAEEFGAIIAEGLKPAVAWLKSVAEKFQQLSPQGKKIIVVVAGLAAAIGPLLIVFGTMATILPTIAAGFAMITGPVGLVIAAIAGVAAAFVYVYGNWQAFKERLSNWGWLRNAAIDAFILLIKTSSYFLNEIAKLFGVDFVAAITDELEKLKSPVEGVKTEFKSFGDTFKDVAGEAMTALGLMGSKGKDAFKEITTEANNTVRSTKRVLPQINSIKKAIIDLKNLTVDKVELIPFKFNYVQTSNAVAGWEEEFYQNWKSTKENIQSILAQTMTEIGVTIGEAIGDTISGIDSNFGANVLSSIGKFMKQLGTALIALAAMMFAFWVTVNLGPVGAIAAGVIGIAAVAAGQVLLNKAKKGPAKMASGGIVPGGFPNDTYPALLSSGETVLPSPIPLSGVGGGNGTLRIMGTTRIAGKDLLTVFDKAVNDRDIIRG